MKPILLLLALAFKFQGILGVDRVDVVTVQPEVSKSCQYDAFTSSTPYNNSKVFLVPYKKAHRKADWNEARGYCAEHCAEMATIQSAEENDFLLTFMRGVGRSPFWLGAQIVNKIEFTNWSNGDTALYHNKKASEYNEDGLTCLNIYDINQPFWYNYYCDDANYLIVCQRSSDWAVCE